MCESQRNPTRESAVQLQRGTRQCCLAPEALLTSGQPFGSNANMQMRPVQGKQLCRCITAEAHAARSYTRAFCCFSRTDAKDGKQIDSALAAGAHCSETCASWAAVICAWLTSLLHLYWNMQ